MEYYVAGCCKLIEVQVVLICDMSDFAEHVEKQPCGEIHGDIHYKLGGRALNADLADRYIRPYDKDNASFAVIPHHERYMKL